jgi:hypothetical protein
MNQLDATMIYWSIRSLLHLVGSSILLYPLQCSLPSTAGHFFRAPLYMNLQYLLPIQVPHVPATSSIMTTIMFPGYQTNNEGPPHYSLHPPAISSLLGSGPWILRSRSHFKMPGARWVTLSSTLGTPHILGANIQNFVARMTQSSEFSHLPLGTRIIFNTAFLHSLRECSSPVVRCQKSHPYIAAEKLTASHILVTLFVCTRKYYQGNGWIKLSELSERFPPHGSGCKRLLTIPTLPSLVYAVTRATRSTNCAHLQLA